MLIVVCSLDKGGYTDILYPKRMQNRGLLSFHVTHISVNIPISHPGQLNMSQEAFGGANIQIHVHCSLICYDLGRTRYSNWLKEFMLLFYCYW